MANEGWSGDLHDAAFTMQAQGIDNSGLFI
jgi:hypothetical protein